jgi:hypothetical protein
VQDAAGKAESGLVTWPSGATDVEPGGFYAATVSQATGGGVLMGLAGVGGLVAGAALALGARRLLRRDADAAGPDDGGDDNLGDQ